MTAFCDRHGVLTDDADRWVGPEADDTFDHDPVGDRDAMSDEYDMAFGTPKCGGPRILKDSPDRRNVGCPGCRHCDPVDHELKPTGFGIDRWDSPLVDRLRRELFATALVTGLSFDMIRDAAVAWSGFSKRRETHSDRVWDRLCDTCDTHTEADAKYRAWARRAVTVRYRDEVKPPGLLAR